MFMNVGIRGLLVVCFYLGAVSLLDGSAAKPDTNSGNAVSHSSASSIGNPQDSENDLAERNYDLEEEHESNGPEGAQGVPMRRLSARGGLTFFAILLASCAVVALAGKRKIQDAQSSDG